MDQLKKILKEKPLVEHVYLNDKSEWLFHEHPNFPNKVLRDEVLAMKNPTDDVESNKSTQPVFMEAGTAVDSLLEIAQKQKEAEEKADAKLEAAVAKAMADFEKARAKAEADKAAKEAKDAEKAAAEAEAAEKARAKAEADKAKADAKSEAEKNKH